MTKLSKGRSSRRRASPPRHCFPLVAWATFASAQRGALEEFKKRGHTLWWPLKTTIDLRVREGRQAHGFRQ